MASSHWVCTGIVVAEWAGVFEGWIGLSSGVKYSDIKKSG